MKSLFCTLALLGITLTTLHAAPLTRSHWIWLRDVPQADNQEAYYRLAFTLPEPVSKAVIRICCDDTGKLFVNGARVGGSVGGCCTYDIAKQLWPGRNVLAVYVKNIRYTGGTLIFAEITLKSGKKVLIHSDETFKCATGISGTEWTAVDFDDSAWKNAVSIGDVTLKPWSGLKAFRTYDFATPEERKALPAQTLK